eukprot:8560401-Alexandrium_andersonii.AAC.1
MGPSVAGRAPRPPARPCQLLGSVRDRGHGSPVARWPRRHLGTARRPRGSPPWPLARPSACQHVAAPSHPGARQPRRRAR